MTMALSWGIQASHEMPHPIHPVSFETPFTATLSGLFRTTKPISIEGFLFGLPLLFQRNQSEGLNAVYHFTFTGSERCQVTITIRDKMLQVQTGHNGKADLTVTADSKTWIGFLCKEQNIIWALIRRKIRVNGSIKLLQAFGKCFPS
jgi:alkyl sulfatase BDS1-like metallo-beta-lactamase superfamily hydrolase